MWFKRVLLVLAVLAVTGGADASPKPVTAAKTGDREKGLSAAFLRADDSCRRAAAQLAKYPAFRIQGKIVLRDRGGLVLWGRTFGGGVPLGNGVFALTDVPANHPGWQREDGNILVTNPDSRSIVYEFYRPAFHYYKGETSGTNAFGARVPCKVYGPPPATVIRLKQDVAAKQKQREAAAKALCNYVVAHHEGLKKTAGGDPRVRVDYGYACLRVSNLFASRNFAPKQDSPDAMRRFEEAVVLFIRRKELDGAVSLLCDLSGKGLFGVRVKDPMRRILVESRMAAVDETDPDMSGRPMLVYLLKQITGAAEAMAGKPDSKMVAMAVRALEQLNRLQKKEKRLDVDALQDALHKIAVAQPGADDPAAEVPAGTGPAVEPGAKPQ